MAIKKWSPVLDENYNAWKKNMEPQQVMGALRRMDDTSVAPLAPKPPSLDMAAFHDTESRGSMGLLDDSSIGSRGTNLHDVARDMGTAAKYAPYHFLPRTIFEKLIPSNNAGGILEQQAQKAKNYAPQTLPEKVAYGASGLLSEAPIYLLGGEIIGAPIVARVTRALPTAGRALPVLNAGRLTAGPVFSEAGANVLGRAAGGYATGAALGGTKGVLEGDSLSEILQGASKEGQLWAGGELGVAGLGAAAKALSKQPELLKIKNLDLTPKRGLTRVEEEAFKTGQDIGQNMPQGQKPSLPVNSAQASANLPLGIGGARRIPEKMEPVGSGQRVRSLGVSVTKAKSTVPEVQRDLINEMVPGGRGVYNVHSNERTIEWADRIVKTDPQEALRYVRENPGTDLSNTVALKLVKKANAEGKFNDATDIIQHISQVATNQGQAIQALRLWGNMTPEGMQRYYVRTIESINRDMEKKLGNKAKKLQVKPEIMQQLKENMEKIGSMVDGREKDIELAKTMDLVAAEVPVSWLDKIASIQTMAQLLNPKTAIRNIVGNLGFAGLENVSSTVGAGVDKVLSLATGQRTKVLPSLGAQVKGFKQGWKHGLEDALLGIDTSGIQGKFDLPKGRVFRGGVLGAAEKALNVELRATDRAFYQSAYEDSLLNQMRAAKVNAPTEDMVNTAHLDALYRTFQDDTRLSMLFTTLKRKLNWLTTGSEKFGAGDFIIKYPKTPANLLMRGIDYSPAGFMKTIIEAARPLAGQKFNQRAFVDAFSRALVGSTALFGTGALLHRLGIITGRPVEDRDLAELQREQGFGEYRINASALRRLIFGNGDTKPQNGDTIVSYDWYQPNAIPLAIGADVDANKGSASGIAGTILNALGTGLNAFAEQPVVQGIQSLFSGGYGEIDKGIVKVLEGVPSSFIPTLFNQVKQLMDNQRRETYSPNSTEKAMNLARNKIPGMALKLPQKYGTLGQPLETYQGGSNNLFNVTLNPAFVNRYNPTPTVQRINDIYQQTGETKQVPRVVPKKITISGQSIELTGPEFSNYQKLVGEYTQQGFSRLPDNMKSEDAASKMQAIMNDANEKAKMQILKARGLNVYKKGSGLKLR